MGLSKRSADHLVAMRTLMERAEVYRAVSAPASLFAGVLAVVVALGMVWYYKRFPGLTPTMFLAIWVGVLLLVLIVSGRILLRESRIQGEPLPSPRMWFAIAQILPAALAGASITFWHWLMIYQIAPLVFYWMVFYGLALLSMDEYAPTSMVVLGWSFLLAGLLTAPVFYLGLERYGAGPVDGAYAMACTFGLFHIVYAICVWPRGGWRKRFSAKA